MRRPADKDELDEVPRDWDRWAHWSAKTKTWTFYERPRERPGQDPKDKPR